MRAKKAGQMVLPGGSRFGTQIVIMRAWWLLGTFANDRHHLDYFLYGI